MKEWLKYSLYVFLYGFLALFVYNRACPTGLVETVKAPLKRLTQTPEERLLGEMAKSRKTLPEIRKEAEAGSAKALMSIAGFYDNGQRGLPRSAEITVQYYIKAYEAAVQGAAGQDKWDEWLAEPADAWRRQPSKMRGPT